MSSIFKAIGKFFKKLFEVLKKILVAILIVVAIILIIWACIFCPPAGGLLLGFFLTQATAIALGCILLVGAFLIDPDEAAHIVGKVGEAAGDVAESVTDAVGDVVGGVADGLMSSGVMWLALGGVALYFVLSGDRQVAETESRPDRVTQREDDSVVVWQEGQPLGTSISV